MRNKKDNSEDKSSRRTFVKLGLVSGALAAIGKFVFPKTVVKPKEGSVEKVKMLTPDGKLVEVDKRIIEAATQKRKATNTEIRDFIDHRKNHKS